MTGFPWHQYACSPHGQVGDCISGAPVLLVRLLATVAPLNRSPVAPALCLIAHACSKQRNCSGIHGCLLESALAAPQNLYLYSEDADLFDIATAYAFHISQNQTFNGGNKRTGLQAAIGFLKGNGYAVETYEKYLFNLMDSLAKVTAFQRGILMISLRLLRKRERGFTNWLRTWLPI